MSEDQRSPSLAEERRRLSPREARDQAAEATGFLASIEIEIVGADGKPEVFEIPQRALLDDDQRERMDELEMETEDWQHEDDIPERHVKNADGSETVIPAQRGPLKLPYRDKDGKLIKPSYPVQVAIALWGAEKYARFKKGGGRGADVTATLAQLDRRIEKRENADPK